MIARRTVLGGLAAVPVVTGLPGMARAAAPMRAVGDLRLAGGQALQRLVRSSGGDFADPQGEIVWLLQGRCADWLAVDAPVVGYTGWSDFHLAGDLARAAGRRIERLPDTGSGGGIAWAIR